MTNKRREAEDYNLQFCWYPKEKKMTRLNNLKWKHEQQYHDYTIEGSCIHIY